MEGISIGKPYRFVLLDCSFGINVQ